MQQPEHSQQAAAAAEEGSHAMEMRKLHRAIAAIAPSGNVQFFTEFDCVRQFHACMETNGTLRVPPSKEVLERRMKLVAEEFEEFRKDMHALIKGEKSPTLEMMARILDHCVDITYVVMGTCAEFGLPFDSAFEIVHLANMNKFAKGVNKNEYGKLIKPEGWQPPDKMLWELVFNAHTAAMKRYNDEIAKRPMHNLEEVPGKSSLMQEGK